MEIEDLKLDVWYNKDYEEVEKLPSIERKCVESSLDFVEILFGLQEMIPAVPIIHKNLPLKKTLYDKAIRKIEIIQSRLRTCGHLVKVLYDKMYFKFFVLDGCIGIKIYASLETNSVVLSNYSGDIQSFIQKELKFRNS